MRVMRLISAACFGFCLMAASAQQNAAAKTITFNAVVHPKAGEASGFPLPASAFTITDNKQPVTPLQIRAHKKGDDAVQVILVLDVVNIPTRLMGGVRQQLDHFLRLGALPYPTTVAIMDDKQTLLTRYSTNGVQLADALAKQTIGVRDRNDEIGLFVSTDRLHRCIQALGSLADAAAKMDGRTVIIWISPGWRYVSGPLSLVNQENEDGYFKMMVALSAKLRDSHVTLDAVDPTGDFSNLDYTEFVPGAKKPAQMQAGHLSLQALALQSGGRTAISNDLVTLMAPCFDDLREYYEITIPQGPAEKPDTYHHLETKVNLPGASVQARTLYYAQP